MYVNFNSLMKFNFIKIKGWFNCFNRNTQVINVSEHKLVIKPLMDFICRYPVRMQHLSCDKLQSVIDKINNGRSNMLLLAMSGMGKTRLVYEAFKDNTPENAYYCEHSQGEKFQTDLMDFLGDNRHNYSLLILDNCPSKDIGEIIFKCNNSGINIRLLFINNDYFDRPPISGLEIVDFTSADMRNEVNVYIEREVYRNDVDRFICERIKDMADGYPYMAILLVDSYKKNGKIGVNDVGILLNKLLGENDKDRISALKCLSFFQPLGWRSPYNQQYEAVLKSSVLTGLFGSVDERRDVFDRCINHFMGEIVEVSSSWVNVRPLPLAIWLVGQWLSEHSVDMLLRVINEFNQMPKRLSAQLADAMYRRLRNMEGNEKAALMVQNIKAQYEDNPFGLEEVVCSELGSRLFLAFAHVNYLATTDCINAVIANKSIEELINDVDGNVRRNIVWTLEKLCYPSDSFVKAALMLARLALAENEDIGNNATGQLTQLFHVMLPGTEASLADRLILIKEMMGNQEVYAPILLPCLSNALLSGSFTKMGGAEQFGLTQRKDYLPKTEEELTSYWTECSHLLIDYLKLHPISLPEVKRIVEERSYQLLHKGRVGVVNYMVSQVHDRLNGDWMEMYKLFLKAKKYFYIAYHKEDKKIIDNWVEKLSPNNFSNELKKVRIEVFEKYKVSYDERCKYAQSLMIPLAEKFVSEKYYEDQDRVSELIDDFEYIDFGFSEQLLSKMDIGSLQEMLDNIYQVIISKGDNVTSPFLYQFCRYLYDKEPFERFLIKLRESKREQTYIHLLANNEGESLNSFHRLESEVAQGKVSKASIAIYLNQVGYASPATMLEMLQSETVKKYVNISEVIKYLERFQFGYDFNGNKELNDFIKSTLLQYEYDEKQPSLNWEYSDFLVRILERDHDPEFAKAVSKKMTKLLNQHYTHSNFERIFPTLLNNYIDDIWGDFSESLVSENYDLFLLQVKDVIGSGFGFGRGSLFMHGDERIKSLCAKYPQRAPYCIALMAPVFYFAKDEEGNAKQEDRFSDIVLWLLEKYGNEKCTLDGLGSNMGSFSWFGSPLPLFMSQIICLKSLLDDSKMCKQVKDWALQTINDLEKQIRAEQSRLDYERIHYK